MYVGLLDTVPQITKVLMFSVGVLLCFVLIFFFSLFQSSGFLTFSFAVPNVLLSLSSGLFFFSPISGVVFFRSGVSIWFIFIVFGFSLLIGSPHLVTHLGLLVRWLLLNVFIIAVLKALSTNASISGCCLFISLDILLLVMGHIFLLFPLASNFLLYAGCYKCCVVEGLKFAACFFKKY